MSKISKHSLSDHDRARVNWALTMYQKFVDHIDYIGDVLDTEIPDRLTVAMQRIKDMESEDDYTDVDSILGRLDNLVDDTNAWIADANEVIREHLKRSSGTMN